MEINQVETFLAVVTYGGFHRAAEALHVSQPAVSGRIRALEESLGVTLFTRGRANPLLSPAGKALRPHAEQILRTVASARQAVHELQPQTGGALRIAASLSICTYLIPDVMQDYKTAIADLLKADQRDPLILALLGESYEKSGDRSQAMDYYRKVLASNAHNPTNAFARPLAKKKLAQGN